MAIEGFYKGVLNDKREWTLACPGVLLAGLSHSGENLVLTVDWTVECTLLCTARDYRSFLHPLQNVRRVALVAFNSAAHNKPSLIRDLLDTLLPNLYKETKIRVSSL